MSTFQSKDKARVYAENLKVVMSHDFTKKCEKCDSVATAFVGKLIENNNNWKYLCDKHTNELFSTYYIPIDKFYEPSMDWVFHMEEKEWFDIIDFATMKYRYEH